MDSKQLGEAGLQGWRGGVADRVAPAVARRTSADVEQVRTAIGGLFLVLSALDLFKATRQFFKVRHRRT